MLVALGFIDRSVSIRLLLRFVRPLRHSVLVNAGAQSADGVVGAIGGSEG
jgi:hypothetical protein